jgi:hypothetical protein
VFVAWLCLATGFDADGTPGGSDLRRIQSKSQSLPLLERSAPFSLTKKARPLQAVRHRGAPSSPGRMRPSYRTTTVGLVSSRYHARDASMGTTPTAMQAHSRSIGPDLSSEREGAVEDFDHIMQPQRQHVPNCSLYSVTDRLVPPIGMVALTTRQCFGSCPTVVMRRPWPLEYSKRA